MSESEYYDAWVADGKPWRNARYIEETVAALKTARPAAARAGAFGSIGDLPHLLADTPQDHTPYSQTGWPLRHPYPRITATDIMHWPHLGVDCNQIFPHWLAAAKAGELPWLKYLIWQRKRYDVRNGWNPVSASGHDDHMHASGRTDHIDAGLGGWHPLPGEHDMTPEQEAHLKATDERVRVALITGESYADNDPKIGTTTPWIVRTLNDLAAAVGKLQTPEIDYDKLAAALAPHLPTTEAIAKAVADEDHKRSAA
jgi:hypothetical protein